MTIKYDLFFVVNREMVLTGSIVCEVFQIKFRFQSFKVCFVLLSCWNCGFGQSPASSRVYFVTKLDDLVILCLWRFFITRTETLSLSRNASFSPKRWWVNSISPHQTDMVFQRLQLLAFAQFAFLIGLKIWFVCLFGGSAALAENCLVHKTCGWKQ